MPCVLNKFALVKGENAVLQPGDQREVVTGDEHAHAHLIELLEQVHDLGGQFGVEVAGGFVGKQDAGPVHDGAGNADALLFAARQHQRVHLLFLQQTNLVQRCTHAAVGLVLRIALNLQRQGNILEHGAVEQQLVILKHHADAAAVVGDLLVRQPAKVLAVHHDLSLAGLLHHHQQLQQGALAGAGATGQERHFAIFEPEADLVQGLVATRIALADIVERDHARTCCSIGTLRGW